MKTLKTILSTLLIITCVLISAAAAWRVYDARVNENPFPTVLGTGFAIVTSGSMEPNIHTNDFVVAKKTTTVRDLNVGDIIIYRSYYVDEPVIHRIVSMEGETIVTQGDANAIADPQITFDQVLAVYKFRVPLIGSLLNSIKTPIGMAVLAVILISLGTVDVVRENNKEKKRLEELYLEKKWEKIAKKSKKNVYQDDVDFSIYD